MSTDTDPDVWTARLAELLGAGFPSDRQTAALQSLASSFETGDPSTDHTRQMIVRLLGQRFALTGQATGAGDAVTAVMPPWPGDRPQQLPPIHPTGLVGTSIVAVNSDQHRIDPAALATWVESLIDEIILVDCATGPHLVQTLPQGLLNDPRLRVVRIAGEACTPSQAFNAGFRLARHARILALAGVIRLDRGYLSSALPVGDFRLDAGSPDGSGFLLDLHRRDLSDCGGFNEHLDSAAWMADDLAACLAGLGRRWGRTPAERFYRLQPVSPERPDNASLGDVLRADPELAALRNRFIAMVMPDWTPAALQPFDFVEWTGLELVIAPAGAPRLKPPAHVAVEAAHHALTELVARRVGGQPLGLSSRRLDIVLARPVGDVCSVDVAVAAGSQPDLVKSRRAWLLVDVATDPTTETTLRAIAELERLAEAHDFTLALRARDDEELREIREGTGFPAILFSAAPEPFTQLSLRRLLAREGPEIIGHASLTLDDRLADDLSHARAGGPTILLRRPKLFIDAQHGLGNRLRAIASAGAIAAATDHELVIIWQPDVHCDCRFDDLFEPGPAVISTGFAPEAAAMNMDVWNYMEVEPGSAKDAPVRLSAFRDGYIRSAYPAVSPHSTWLSENRFLHQLTPNAVVQDLVASVRSPNAVSVHIRMEGGTSAEHLPYESRSNWTANAHREIDHWRQRSHFGYFLPRLDGLMAEGRADTLFLATDTLAVYTEFAGHYADRVTWLARKVADRSHQAIVYALADAILLSRAPLLLGSNWSSFTELAARLASEPISVELSGRDF